MRSSSSNAIIGCSHRKQRHTKEFLIGRTQVLCKKRNIYLLYIITFTLRKLRVHSFGAILAILIPV